MIQTALSDRRIWRAILAIMIAAIVASGCDNGKGWPRWRIGSHREAAVSGAAGTADCVAEAGTVSIGPVDEGRVLVAHLPASGALQLAVVSLREDGVEIIRSWDIEEGIAVGPARSRVLANKLALDWRKSGDIATDLWYIHPWTGQLVRCRVLKGGSGSHGWQHELSRYALPGQQRGAELSVTQTAIACSVTTPATHVVIGERNGKSGPVSLHTFQPIEDSWRSRVIWPKYLGLPRIAMGGSGLPRVFCLTHLASVPEAIVEVRPESEERLERVASGNYIGNYAVVTDTKGRAHVAYQDHSLATGGAVLRHVYEAGHSWEEEVIAEVGRRGVDLDQEPLRADLRPGVCFSDDGTLHVTYFDYSADVVRYASNASGSWKSQMVAPAEAVSCTDVAVRGDRVYVAYGDVAERAVYVAVLGIKE